MKFAEALALIGEERTKEGLHDLMDRLEWLARNEKADFSVAERDQLISAANSRALRIKRRFYPCSEVDFEWEPNDGILL